MAIAKKISLSVFIKNVKTGGAWDYKSNIALKKGVSLGLYNNNLLQEFGNYHFGVVANAFGFGLETSMAGAGIYQVTMQGGGSIMGMLGAADMSIFGAIIPNSISTYVTNQGFNWGDNPGDAQSIMQGWNDANGL
jgi:hypothetical protein